MLREHLEMQKRAAKAPAPAITGGFGERLLKTISHQAPRALVYGATGMGILGGMNLYHKIQKRMDYHKGFESMLDVHPSLKKEDPKLVQTRYDSLFNLAPTLAQDPLVAGSIVKQWIEYPVVSATTLKDVARAEADVRPGRALLTELLGAGHVLAGGGG